MSSPQQPGLQPAEPQAITGAAQPTAHTPDSIRLERRRLSRPEAARIHEELKSTANILGYSVRELLSFQNVLVAMAANAEGVNDFAGVCISKDLLLGWTDIAVLYVLPEFRGRKIGSLLFTNALTNAEERQRHIFTLSRSPEVLHVMERMGMQIGCPEWGAPLPVILDTQLHMMNGYRWIESFRKLPMRMQDGNRFRSGVKRWKPSPRQNDGAPS